MSTIFVEDSVASGTLVKAPSITAVKSNDPTAMLISLGLNSDQGTGIVTGMSISQETSTQFQQALDRNVFAIAFGDAPGTLQVNLLLNRVYQGADQLAAFLAFYTRKRLTPANTTPLSWQIGSTSFKGFILGFEIHADARDMMTLGTLRCMSWLDTADGWSAGQ